MTCPLNVLGNPSFCLIFRQKRNFSCKPTHFSSAGVEDPCWKLWIKLSSHRELETRVRVQTSWWQETIFIYCVVRPLVRSPRFRTMASQIVQAVNYSYAWENRVLLLTGFLDQLAIETKQQPTMILLELLRAMVLTWYAGQSEEHLATISTTFRARSVNLNTFVGYGALERYLLLIPLNCISNFWGV